MPAGESAGIKMPTSCTMSPKCDPVTITGVTHNSPQETKTKSEKTCGIRSHTNIYLSFLLRTNINCHRHKKIKPILNWLGGNMSNLEPRQYSIFGNNQYISRYSSMCVIKNVCPRHEKEAGYVI